MRISDWSSDVCSSDLPGRRISTAGATPPDEAAPPPSLARALQRLDGLVQGGEEGGAVARGERPRANGHLARLAQPGHQVAAGQCHADGVVTAALAVLRAPRTPRLHTAPRPRNF